MSLVINISLVGDKSIIRKMNSIKNFFKSQELLTVLEDAKNRMVFIAGRLAPKGDSRLLSQVYGSVKNFGTDKVNIEMKSPARYAAHQEFGTKAHEIKPRLKQTMFWVNYSTPKNRLYIETKSGKRKEIGAMFTFMPKPVMHPGTKEQPFMRPAVERTQPALVRAIQRIIKAKLGT